MGMVVRTNTMALNAYRQLGMNNSAVAKSLEKLSSGFRINRAGDDAAGLAISEKMKAQIKGLETASANAQDGISLIQTAEGNLGEVHDMLNRMVELATKAANGTYTEQERKALQSEVDQLLDEIDRISKSANFNGAKLLNGNLDSGPLDAAKEAAASVSTVYKELTADEIDKIMLEGESTDSSKVGKETVVETGSEKTEASAQVNFDGIKHILTADNGGTEKLTLTVGGVDISITEAQLAAVMTDKSKGAEATSADIAKAFAASGKFDKAGTETNVSDGLEIDGNKFSVTAENGILKMTLTEAAKPDEELNLNYELKFESAVTGATVTIPAKNSYTTGVYVAGTANAGTGTALTVKVKVGGNEVNFTTANFFPDAGAGGAVDAETLATFLSDAEGSVGGTDVALSTYFDIAATEDGKITFTSKDGSEVVDITGTVTGGGASFDTAFTTKELSGANTITTGTTGYSNFGTQNIHIYKPVTADNLASTTLHLQDYLKDGAQIELNGEKYVIALGEKSEYWNAEGAVQISDADKEDIGKIASAFTVAAKDNKTFTVGQSTTAGDITLKQKIDVKTDTDMNSRAEIAQYIKISTVDAAATAEAKQAAKDKLAELEKSGKKALVLQIGDTAEDFNKMAVNIQDMSANGLKLEDLKETGILTEDGASKAIQTIKDAINTVSTVRADMGALQNRLEHTINNLDVTAENLSAANSRIRDTDMAKEMMNYTKMNVLVQSAQAMLAQANQQPQSVLQLLQ